MRLNRKIIYINLIILIAVALATFFFLSGEDDYYAGIGFGIIMLYFNAAHIFICLVVGIVHALDKTQDERRKEIKNGFFLSAALIAVIGPSLCFGGLAAFG